jgi:hypothetical protein
VPCDTGYANAIVTHGGYSAGYMGSVTVMVTRIIVVKYEVPATDVIDKPVAIIV